MLMIRFRIQGKINKQSFRLVVADRRSPLDGKYVEKLGWYDPLSKEEKNLIFDEEKVLYWLDRGAQLSPKVATMIRRTSPDLLKNYFSKKREKKVKKKTK